MHINSTFVTENKHHTGVTTTTTTTACYPSQGTATKVSSPEAWGFQEHTALSWNSVHEIRR